LASLDGSLPSAWVSCISLYSQLSSSNHQFALQQRLGCPISPEFAPLRPLGNGHNEVKLSLMAASADIAVGGYRVTTENYNHNFLTPIIEAMPGDTVSARLVNALSAQSQQRRHASQRQPTNLHYFHGGIVSPNNARPMPAELGTGDNIYVHLKSGLSFDFKVPIPGEKPIPAMTCSTRAFSKARDISRILLG